MSAARERAAHAPNSTVILGVVSAAATPKLIAAILRPPAVATAATPGYVADGDAGLDDWPNLDDLRRRPDRHRSPRSDAVMTSPARADHGAHEWHTYPGSKRPHTIAPTRLRVVAHAAVTVKVPLFARAATIFT